MENNLSIIVNEFSHLNSDYRGEVYAAELLKKKVAHDRIYFKTISDFRRTVSRDIEKVKLHTTNEGDSQIVMELNREGLYDMLPEGVFHYKKDRKASRDKDDILDDIRISRAEETASRKFFEPFENEFFHRRLQLELEEQSFANAFSIKNKRRLFEKIFGSSAGLDDQQVLSLIYLLPIVYKIKGDLVKASYCISLLTGHDSVIEMVSSSSVKKFMDDVPVVGEMQLGVSSVVGDSFLSCDPLYRIHIYGVCNKDIRLFFNKGKKLNIMDFILPFIFSVQSGYELELHLKEEEKHPFLSGESTETFLSFNSYI